MNLFEIRDNVVQIQPEAYMLAPFRALWDRDDTPSKSVAQAELAFVYYMADYKSDFAQETDYDKRAAEILRNIPFLPKGWIPDVKIKEAIEFYQERQQTISILLLQDIYVAINNLRKFYREVDLTETDDNGKPIHDVTKLTRAIEATSKIIESLERIEDKIKKDLSTSGTLRGGKEKGFFEDIDEDDQQFLDEEDNDI